MPAAADIAPTDVSTAKRCDLCGDRSFELVATLDRRENPLNTVVCTTCGLVAHARIPTDAELDRYYADEYRQDYHGEFTPSDRRICRAWNNGQRLLRQLSPYIDRSAKVFEIGAGIGCNVKSFELAGYETAGIEPGVGFQQYAQQKLLADIKCERLFDLPQTPKHDLVLLIHVIEHFNSPRKALDHIHSILRPGGKLYVECPNLAAPFARKARMFHFAHIHNFTPATLAMMAVRCGFHVERQFSTHDDPNLQMLLTKVETTRRVIHPESYGQTKAALNRYNNFTYHVRWNYVWPRVKKLASYLGEHVSASGQVRKLLTKCYDHAQSKSVTRQESHRRAA